MFAMHPKNFLILIQSIILYILRRPISVKAITGSEVRNVLEYQFSAVVCIAKHLPSDPLHQNVFCTGVLVSSSHVLTAESCLDQVLFNPIHIIVSPSGDISRGVCTFPIWWISYEQWAVQLHHNIVTAHNNLAIIKTFGILPNIHIPTLSPISPLNVIEGFHVELYGCQISEYTNTLVKTVTARAIRRSQCEHTISELEGTILHVPDNYVCSISSPVSHLEAGDTGGPVVFFDTIVGVSIGVIPPMNGQYHINKVNAHIGIEQYRAFLIHIVDS